MRTAAVVALLTLALAGCDAGPKAASSAPSQTAAADAPVASSDAPSRAPPQTIPTVEGKPLWTSNRRMSAEENARSHFERDGADFDARTVDEFVAKAHAFTAKPPKGTLTLERRNGDRLLYDPKGNVFAVVARSGAPRTMFKPRDGMAYWQRQVRIEAEKSAGR